MAAIVRITAGGVKRPGSCNPVGRVCAPGLVPTAPVVYHVAGTPMKRGDGEPGGAGALEPPPEATDDTDKGGTP